MSQDGLEQALPRLFERAAKRAADGKREYGYFRPESDGRDLITEAKEEIEDAVCYLAMLWARLDKLGALQVLKLAEEALRWRAAWGAAMVRNKPLDQTIEEAAVVVELEKLRREV